MEYENIKIDARSDTDLGFGHQCALWLTIKDLRSFLAFMLSLSSGFGLPGCCNLYKIYSAEIFSVSHYKCLSTV